MIGVDGGGELAVGRRQSAQSADWENCTYAVERALRHKYGFFSPFNNKNVLYEKRKDSA